jgi:hypothetical protein
MLHAALRITSLLSAGNAGEPTQHLLPRTMNHLRVEWPVT